MKLPFSTLKNKISLLLSDRLVKTLGQLFIVIMSVFITILVWKWNSLPPQIPLFYSLPRSSEILAVRLQFIVLPIYSIIFFAANFLLSVYFYEKERLASLILVFSATFMSFLLLVTCLQIIFLVN